MKKPIITIIILLVYIGTVISQESKEKVDSSVYAEEDQYEDDPYFWSYTKEIGINFTPLVSKLVPFNLGQNDSGLIGLRWKKYYSSRAFRINFGANVSGDVIDNGNPFIYLSFGVEKRYPITKDKKLAYIDYGAIALRREVVAAFPEGASDLAVVQRDLAKAGKLRALVAADRFHEIGSEAGLRDLEAYLAEQSR